MSTTCDEHFHLLTKDEQTDRHTLIIVQTQESCKASIMIIVQIQGLCNVVQIQGSCNFNLTSTGKGDIGKLLYYKWASTRENLSSGGREQQRRRPTCASAQSD